jgi:ribosomal subunit interface protein
MEIPLQIAAHDIDLTDTIKAEIMEKAGKLAKFYDRIMRCRVVIESPRRHQHEGKLYTVHIYMTVPGAELVVKHALNKDLYVALRDAFHDARRKLEDFVREQRGNEFLLFSSLLPTLQVYRFWLVPYKLSALHFKSCAFN